MQGVPGQPPPGLQPQQQQVIILQNQPQAPRTTPKTFDNYLNGQSMVLGSIQVAFGIIAIIVNGIAFKYDREDHREENLSHSACGIWAGLFFILTGAFGIAAASRKTMCYIVTFMVLSIVSVSVINFAFLGITIAGVAVANSDDCSYIYSDYYPYSSNCHYYGKNEGLLGTMATLLTIALIEPIIAIWSSIICCMAVCCGRRRPTAQAVTGTIQYTTGGAQGQMIVINGGQPVSYPQGQVPYPQGQVHPAYPQQQGQVMATGQQPPAYPTQPVYPANAAPAPSYPYPAQAPPPQGQPIPPPMAGPAPPAYNPSAPPPVYTELINVDVKK